MKCVHLNIPNVIFVMFSFILNSIRITEMSKCRNSNGILLLHSILADNHNHMDLSSKDSTRKNSTYVDSEPIISPKNTMVILLSKTLSVSLPINCF